MRMMHFACAALLLSATFLPSSFATAAPLTGGTGPGGIGLTGSGNLSIWLRADSITQADNTPVALWDNERVGGVDATQGTSTLQPIFRTGQINGGQLPVLRYDGVSGQYLSTAFTMGGTAFASSFAVTRQNVTQYGVPFITQTAPYFGLHANNDGANQTYNTYAPGSTANTRINGVAPSFLALGTNGILAGTHGAYAGAEQTGTYTLPLGRDLCCAGRNLNGDIAEIAVFNTQINSAQQIIVENYLSSKYDIPLNTGGGATDVYGGDTLSLGNFDFNVFGIGRAADGSQVLSGGSAGMGIEVASLPTNNQWVLAGHDAGPNGVTGADVPFGNQRWERSWYLQTTGVAAADLAFAWNDALNTAPYDPSFKLLFFRPINSGPFTLVATGIVDTFNQRVDFGNVTLQDGYYTLGAPPVPEPSTLALLGLGAVGLAIRTRRRRVRN